MCRFDSDDFRRVDANSEDTSKHLSLSARVECAQMRNDLFVGGDVQFAVTGDRGVFEFAPVTMRIMAGKGTGHIDAGPISRWIDKAKDVLGAKCTVFYEGSVQP